MSQTENIQKDVPVITIGDKHYDRRTVTEAGENLLSDLRKIDQHLAPHHMAISIANIAKQTIIESLEKEALNFTEVVKEEKK